MTERPAGGSGGGFEDDVATALRTLPPDDLAAPGMAARVPHLARRRRRVLRGGVLLAAAAVTAVLGVAGAGLVGGQGFGLVRPAAPTAPPPAVDTLRPYIFVGSRVVEPGGRVSLFVVNPQGVQFETYGVAGTVDRWTASGWKRVGVFVSGAGDVPVGRVYVDAAASQPLAAAAVGLAAPAFGAGPRETVAFTDVPPGWYRLGHGVEPTEGAGDAPRVAYGVVEVREGTSSTEPDREPGRVAFLSARTAVRAGTPTPRVVVQVLVVEAADVSALTRAVGTVDTRLRVQRWDGTGWADVPAATVTLRPEEPGPYGYVTDLPALDAGDYRLVGTASAAGTFYGYVTAVPV